MNVVPGTRIVGRLLVILGALLIGAAAVDAQSERSPPRIAILLSAEPVTDRCTSDTPQVALPALFEGLRALGYVRDQNVTFECRSSAGRNERLDTLAAELVQRKPAVIVTGGAPAALAAKRATPMIPIVSLYTADPVGIGLVKSLSRPGGNVTGISALAADYAAKALELLKDAVPGVSRVGVIGDDSNPTTAMYRASLEAASKLLSVKLEYGLFHDPGEVEPTLTALRIRGVDAIFVMNQPMTWYLRREIVAAVANSRLPAIYGAPEAVEAGGLLAYATSIPEVFRRGAHVVDRILRGARPADIPVEQPVTFVLAVNLRTAHSLGIKIPKSILLRADRVLE